MDLADGQGWDHALLTTLFNPRPPAPKCGLTFLLSHRWMQEERGGRASCTPTHSLSILKPGEGGNRVQPEAAHRCHLCLELRTLVGGGGGEQGPDQCGGWVSYWDLSPHHFSTQWGF